MIQSDLSSFAGAHVSNDEPLYPDFTVDRFWGVPRDEDRADEIAIVVEVASLLRIFDGSEDLQKYKGIESMWTPSARRFKRSIIAKFESYLRRAVQRSGRKKVLGLLFLGPEVLIAIAEPPAVEGDETGPPVYPYEAEFQHSAGYMHAFDPRLMDQIDAILQIHD